MKPTDEQVKTEIATLKEIKPRVRKTSAFGDNHHDSIDAQIEVLEKRLSSDKIYDKFEETGDSEVDADEGRGENVISCALDALYWRDGENEEAPSVGWKSLMK